MENYLIGEYLSNNVDNLSLLDFSKRFFTKYHLLVLKYKGCILLSNNEKNDIVGKANKILSTTKDLNSKDFSVLESLKIQLEEKSNKLKEIRIKELCSISKPMEYFVKLKPENKKAEQYFDAIESLINIVENFYNIKENDVVKGMIVINDKTYKMSSKKTMLKEGVMIKKYPYSSHFVCNSYSILGECNFEATSQTLSGGYQYCILLRLDYYPTKQELIDEIIMIHYTHLLEPVGYVQTDIKRFPIYPSTKDVFKNGRIEYKELDKRFYIDKSQEEINELELIDEK